ncbi:MAG: hypothetical protein IJX78_06055 [Bacilli bacterium]|nr:hypothetical protein [Bacilli bacterium]
MNKKGRIFVLIGLILSLFLITSCDEVKDDIKDDLDDVIDEVTSPFKEATAYGIVYKDYVGMARVITANDIIVHIDIDEAFMPIVWAQETKAGTLTDVVTKEDGSAFTTNNELRYAKYIKIGDTVFTGVPYTDEELKDVTSTKQLIKYSSEKIADLHKHLLKEENAKWYIEEILKGNAYVCDKDGKRVETTDVNLQGALFKSNSLYWTTGETGWAKNIQYFTNALIGTKMTDGVSMEDGFVKVGDVVTSATFMAYQDYYDLVKKAYEAIK